MCVLSTSSQVEKVTDALFFTGLRFLEAPTPCQITFDEVFDEPRGLPGTTAEVFSEPRGLLGNTAAFVEEPRGRPGTSAWVPEETTERPGTRAEVQGGPRGRLRT